MFSRCTGYTLAELRKSELVVLEIACWDDNLSCQGMYTSQFKFHACSMHYIISLLISLCNCLLPEHQLQMIANRAFVEARPLQIVSVGLTAAAAFYVARLGLRELEEDATN